jgi:hypothetical protein
MKKTILFLGLTTLFVVVGGARSMAYDHDDKGWIDDHHQHHPFIYHHHHRGYWDNRSGARVFINV